MPHDLIYGHPADVAVPDGWTVAGAVAVLRCTDTDGQRRVLTVYAGDVQAWEALGMVGVADADVRAHLAKAPTVHPERL